MVAFQVALPRDDHRALRQAALDDGVSAAGIVRELVAGWRKGRPESRSSGAASSSPKAEDPLAEDPFAGMTTCSACGQAVGTSEVHRCPENRVQRLMENLDQSVKDARAAHNRQTDGLREQVPTVKPVALGSFDPDQEGDEE